MADASCPADRSGELTCNLERLFAEFLDQLDRCLRQPVRRRRNAKPPESSPSAPVQERTCKRWQQMGQHEKVVAVHHTQRGCGPPGPAQAVARKMDTAGATNTITRPELP
ncbi:Hypothetical predicted protein [Pelobates cultripes]|uniref:Uncharacterized protein n=1 Tax=Pelobates cultripes TaxID=61616 RepID=A0AAD1S8S2_PELCU|nr:Hypothetical predicted protein [Pelobates cultripes]